MNKAPSSPKTAKTTRPTSAPGTVRGILLQVTRFLYYLLTVGQNDVVSLELFEDVGVEQQGGSRIAEQDKSYLSANPLADRSIEFWKTFRNWVDAAAAGELAPNQTWFVLYAPRAPMGQIVKAFHDATTDHAAKHALEKAQQVLSGDNGLEIGAAARKHVEAVVCADSKLVVGIIKRFTVDGDQHPADALRPLLHDKLVGEDSFDDVVTWAQGWVKQTIDRFVEQGQAARVVKQDFHQALLNYVRLHDRTNILRSVAGTATDREVATELVERDYVSQLQIIDLGVCAAEHGATIAGEIGRRKDLMSTTFRRYAPDQSLLLPPDVRAWLPEGHLAHHIRDLVDGLDLTAFYAAYAGDGRRNAPYAPRMMVKVLLYAYATGVFSSRGIARRLEAHASPYFCRHQITPKTSRYTRCSMSMLPNVSINRRTRSSGQLGRWWYSISPCRNNECVRRFTVFAFNQRS